MVIIMEKLIDKLIKNKVLDKNEFLQLITQKTASDEQYLFEQARKISQQSFGNNIYIRGLIEISNYCCNDCYYCGIRKSNKNVIRYRLNKQTVLECCKLGYNAGFRTFVLQGG